MIAILLVFLARAFKALSDITKSSWGSSIFADKYPEGTKFYSWAGPGDSWKNKWKTDKNNNIIPISKSPWYYFGWPLANKERFIYSRF